MLRHPGRALLAGTHDGRHCSSVAPRAHRGQRAPVVTAQPLSIVRGWKQYLYDETGRRYIDALQQRAARRATRTRAVVAAVSEQLAVLNTNTRYLQELPCRVRRGAAGTLPRRSASATSPRRAARRTNSPCAWRAPTPAQRDLLVMDAAYHGHTTTLIDISPYKHDGPGRHRRAGLGPHVAHSRRLSRRAHGRRSRGRAEVRARWWATVIDGIRAQRARPVRLHRRDVPERRRADAAAADGFLAEVYRLVRAAGGVCIADEVQTGFGRIGTHFWAFERARRRAGHRRARQADRQRLPDGRGDHDARDRRQRSTTGWSSSAPSAAAPRRAPPAWPRCARRWTSGLLAHALRVGDALLASLRALQDAARAVGDVRGAGLFIGVELVRTATRASRRPTRRLRREPRCASWAC